MRKNSGRSPSSSWWSILNIYCKSCNFVASAPYMAKGIPKETSYKSSAGRHESRDSECVFEWSWGTGNESCRSYLPEKHWAATSGEPYVVHMPGTAGEEFLSSDWIISKCLQSSASGRNLKQIEKNWHHFPRHATLLTSPKASDNIKPSSPYTFEVQFLLPGNLP